MSKIFRTLAVATCLLGIAFSQEFAPSEKFSEHVHEAQARLFNRDLPTNEIERALESGSDSILVGRGMRFFTDTNPDTVSARSASMICSADTIAIVLIENHESFFSSRKDWIFTDYAAKVRRVIKNDAIHPLQPGPEIIIGQNGGRVKIGPQRYLTVDIEDAPQLIENKEYLVFLHFVPDSGQYVTKEPAFQVEGQLIKSLEGNPDVDDISRIFTLSALSEYSNNTSLCGLK